MLAYPESHWTGNDDSIDDLKALNKKLENQSSFFEYILNNIPSDIAVFSADHKYLFVNPQGIKDDKIREFIIGKDDFDYCEFKGLPVTIAENRRALFKQVVDSKEEIEWEEESQDNEGIRKVILHGFATGIAVFTVIVLSVLKFSEGTWVVVIGTPLVVLLMLKFNNQYTREQEALEVKQHQERATSIARHDVTVLVDNVDIATVGAIRYARSLKPRNLSAVHFVIDDRRAEDIQRAWAASDALDDVTLELIDCPDRRLANAALDYSIRMTEKQDVELTLLLPRRAYSGFLGRLLHDQTAEEIAAPISQLPRVVATIVPFDVDRIASGKTSFVPAAPAAPAAPVVAPRTVQKVIPVDIEPVSHYAENLTPIGKIEWRKRAQVQGRVTSIKTAPRGSAPVLVVEIWDETGGVSLQFLGRREIAGLEVGSQLRAEGMVGEEEGSMVILNPSYELLV